jgi:hypothetical protein
MGRPEAARTHVLADCFAYPKGNKFRERVWKLRKREYERKGLPTPKLMQREEKMSSEDKPAKKSNEGDGNFY